MCIGRSRAVCLLDLHSVARITGHAGVYNLPSLCCVNRRPLLSIDVQARVEFRNSVFVARVPKLADVWIVCIGPDGSLHAVLRFGIDALSSRDGVLSLTIGIIELEWIIQYVRVAIPVLRVSKILLNLQ